MAENYAIQAIQSVLNSQLAYCKFLSANDTGLTGGHQAGIYISKPSIPILFDEPGKKVITRKNGLKLNGRMTLRPIPDLFTMDRAQEMNTV